MTPLAVTACAAVTAAGSTAEQTACSIRARLQRCHDHGEVRALPPEGEDAEPIVVASVRSVDEKLPGHARIVELLAAALADLLGAADLEPKELASAGLLLALPAEDEVVAAWPLEALAADVRQRTGLSFKITRRSRTGHPGVLDLLEEASALLDGGEVDACVVAGVDSFVDEGRLAALDASERVHTRRNADGFCPAEGAAAILVEAPRRMRARGASAIATISALGRGKEPNALVGSDRQSTGAGLTEAIRAATFGAAPAWVLDDLNGERYRAFEWGVVQARLGDVLSGVRRVEHPALATGDVGAATGGVLLATAITAIQRGWARGDVLVFAASEGPLRVAARVTTAEAPR